MIYLDYASTSFPKPEEVYVFMNDFYRSSGVNPGRAKFNLCRQAADMVNETRQLLTRFFNGTNPNRLVFTSNSTDGLNLAISGILESGDHAITTTLEHNSVLRPLYHLYRDRVIDIDYVPFDDQGFVDPGDFAKRIRKNTKLVAMTHGSNVLGSIQPIREIGRICRNHGVNLLIDASQTAGKIPIDIQDDFIDILAFTGHKSMYGPTGTGGLYVREGVSIRHTRSGGSGILSELRTHVEEYPHRLEYGTANLVGIAGLNAGVKWIQRTGINSLMKHEMELTKTLMAGLQETKGVTLYHRGDLKNRTAIVLLNISGKTPGDVETLLDERYQTACRTGLHCAPLVHKGLGTDKLGGAVRLSIGAFNTEDEIASSVEALREIAGN